MFFLILIIKKKTKNCLPKANDDKFFGTSFCEVEKNLVVNIDKSIKEEKVVRIEKIIGISLAVIIPVLLIAIYFVYRCWRNKLIVLQRKKETLYSKYNKILEEDNKI